MKKVAKMPRSHRELILSCFRARCQLRAGAVEGVIGKVRVTTKLAYGFRTYRAVEVRAHRDSTTTITSVSHTTQARAV